MNILTMIHLSFKSWFRIKGGFWGPLLFLFFMFIVEGSFWNSLNNHGTLELYSLNELLFYSFSALTVSQMVAVLGEPDSLSEKIESGTLDIYILRPNAIAIQFVQLQLGITLARLSFALPLLICLKLIFFNDSIVSIFVVIPLLLMASLINMFINLIISSLTFWLKESYAFVLIKETMFWMLSGTLIPLDLFPAHFRSALENLPTAYTVFLPIQVILGKANFLQVFIGQMIYLFFCLFISHVMIRSGIKKYQAYGS